MEKKKLLNILRNPASWHEDEVRKARLLAADIIENVVDDTFYFKRKPPIDRFEDDGP